jgi:adenylate cyclase
LLFVFPFGISMAEDQFSRKLAVLLHADVVGSTSLVQMNEILAHERIQNVFLRFSETIAAHGGIAHEIRGDALVAEFSKASDAVAASLSFQKANAAHNEKEDDDVRPVIRVGIAIGEVVVADNTITGEGIVLAQRLEQFAEPGGICIQGAAQETVPKRLPYDYENLGELMLKGFDSPLRAYAVRAKPDASTSISDPPIKSGVKLEGQSSNASIAVLPFTNMSNDPEQEFFSDGITEDIITELSKVSALKVIARTSTFIYRGKSIDIRQVGKELGVSHVLEGSVRKSGNRIRVTAQLIDSSTGQHMWAERYDRELVDIFEVQDEIMREIVSALDVEMLAGEQSRFWSDGTSNLQAWEYYRQARDLFGQYRSKHHPEVIRLVKKALEFDSEYSAAWHLLAVSYFNIEDDTRYSDAKRTEARTLSREYLEQCFECDPTNPDAWSLRAMHNLTDGEFDKAVADTNQAAAMAPNHANIIAVSAMILNKCGQSKIALERIQKAMSLCPIYPLWYLLALGQISRMLGKIDAAIDAYKEMINRDFDSFEGHVGLAGILGETDQIKAAKAEEKEVIRINSQFSIAEYTDNIAYRDSSEITRISEGLSKAGLPE